MVWLAFEPPPIIKRMRKTLFYLSITFVAMVLLLASCGGKQKPNGATTHSQEIKQHIAEVKDSAVLVRLEKVGDDSITVVDNHTGNRTTFDYSRALTDKSIKGSLTPKDTLSIVVAGDKQIKSIVNISELLGKWFYDVKQHRGFEFKYGGSMSAINNQLVCYTKWKVLNGTLFLYYLGMQQVATSTDDFQVDTAEIVSLSREKMDITFRGANLKCKRMNREIRLSDLR